MCQSNGYVGTGWRLTVHRSTISDSVTRARVVECWYNFDWWPCLVRVFNMRKVRFTFLLSWIATDIRWQQFAHLLLACGFSSSLLREFLSLLTSRGRSKERPEGARALLGRSWPFYNSTPVKFILLHYCNDPYVITIVPLYKPQQQGILVPPNYVSL